MENQRRENHGRRTTGTGYKARGVDSSRAPSSSSPSSAMGGIPDDDAPDARRRRFVSVTTTDAGHLFTPRRRRGKGGRSRRRARVPSVVRRRDEPPLARGFAGDDDAIGPRSVRDRSIGDRSGRRRRVVASSRWIRMGDISLRPFSPGVVLGRRRRGTAGTANARAHPRVGSGWVRPRAHVSPSSALGRRRVDFFFLDFQSTMMPFDES